MERAPPKLLKKCINPKIPEIELDGFTKLGPIGWMRDSNSLKLHLL